MGYGKFWRAAVAAAAVLVLSGAGSAEAQEGPPREEGPFRKPDLVELAPLDPTFRLDIRYATSNNFAGRVVYDEARAFLQRPAAEALVRVARRLRERGFGIIIYDGYRPWSVTKIFWDITPSGKKKFVANPKKGSRHNRGVAIDLSLYDLRTGQPAEMPSGYDEFTKRAAINYTGGTETARYHRDLLRWAMQQEGFYPHKDEWWHYDYETWHEYPILNVPFSQIGREKAPGRAQASDQGTAAAGTPTEVPASAAPAWSRP